MLNFPSAIDAAAVRRGLELARRRDARIVGAWLSADTDATPLEEVGFERGWEPWWMAASLDAIAEPDDPRVTLSADVPEYGPAGQLLLSLAKGQRPRACHAVARVEGRFAGRAWCIFAGHLAGIYDMNVWPQFQRRGLGRALVRGVCADARAAGATKVVLNATPEGEPLYSAEGFIRVGEGITYWNHLTARC
jgi:ribosomal protein S18 acetylase RimI-like enzyme